MAPDREALLRAIAANHRAMFRRRSDRPVERHGGIDLIVSGGEGFIAFPATRTRAAVTWALDRARALELGTVSCWSLDEDKALGTLLIARGFEWGWQPWWMALDLDELPDEDPQHRVQSGRRGATHVLAVRESGKNLGGAIVNPWRRIAGIYDMGVRPDHRRRGIGRSLTLAAGRLARKLGCTHAVLNATPEGELLYRTVGFRRLGEGRTWWRHPGERTTARQEALVEAIGFGELAKLEALRPSPAELERPIGGAGPPLVIAVLTGQAGTADWILERRPDLVSADLGDPGYTLLHAAAEWDAAAIAEVALARGADPTIRDGNWNGTPLSWAEHFGREGIKGMLS